MMLQVRMAIPIIATKLSARRLPPRGVLGRQVCDRVAPGQPSIPERGRRAPQFGYPK